MKVIFIPGYTDDAVICHGVSRQEMNFLQKPFSMIALAQKVREVLDSKGKPVISDNKSTPLLTFCFFSLPPLLTTKGNRRRSLFFYHPADLMASASSFQDNVFYASSSKAVGFRIVLCCFRWWNPSGKDSGVEEDLENLSLTFQEREIVRL